MTVLTIPRDFDAPDVIRFNSLNDAFDNLQDMRNVTIIDEDNDAVYHYNEQGVLRMEEEVIDETE